MDWLKKKLLEVNETLMQIVNDEHRPDGISPIYKQKFSSNNPAKKLLEQI